MSWNKLLPFCFALGTLGAASAAGDIIDRIAVSVGNRVVTVSDIDREIRVTAFLNSVKPEIDAAARRATAERMVEQKLIRRELETARFPQPDASEIEPTMRMFKSDHYPDAVDYQRALVEYGITEQEVKDELLWQRTLLRFIDIRFRPAVQVSDQEIQDYFEKTVAPAARAAHPGEPLSLDDYRSQIEDKLAGERVDQELDKWLKQARERTAIVYHDEVFQ